MRTPNMKKLFFLFTILSLLSCEKEPYTDIRGTWEASDPNYNIKIDLFQSGTVISGSGVMTLYFSDKEIHDITVRGSYFYPGMILKFVYVDYQSQYPYDYNGELFGTRTIQGKLDGKTNLTFKRL